MKLFNHAFSFGLEVISCDEKAGDVTGADLRRSLLARLALMSDAEVLDACDGGSPFDSAEVEADEAAQIMGMDISEAQRGWISAEALSKAARKRPLDPDSTPITYQCRECGSTDVLHDAWAQWNEERQDFEVSSVLDATFCTACEHEQRLMTVPLAGPGQQAT